MPVNNTDKIRDLERQMATLDERVDTLRRDVDKNVQKVNDVDLAVREIKEGHNSLSERVGRIEKARDEVLSKRWELGKLVLAAILGAIVTLGTQYALRTIEQRTPNPPGRGAKTAPTKLE